MVKVEGTLDELKALFIGAALAEGKRQVKKAGKNVVKAGVKGASKRVKSAWQIYMANPANQIKFKRGPKKGRLDLKRMATAYRRGHKARGRGR